LTTFLVTGTVVTWPEVRTRKRVACCSGDHGAVPVDAACHSAVRPVLSTQGAVRTSAAIGLPENVITNWSAWPGHG